MCQTKKILFLGGSITAGAFASERHLSWPALCYEKIAGPLFGHNCTMINASISGTGSFVAAARLKQHVLHYAPDMVFIEFAVNDLFEAEENPDAVISSLDYIIRTLQKTNPNVVIVFAYTTYRGRNASKTHHIVAQHYGIPELDFQTPIAELVEAGTHTWDDFLRDLAHPNDVGHRFYADIAANTILADPQRFLTPTRQAEPIGTYRFRNADIIPAEKADSLEGFTMTEARDRLKYKNIPELIVTHAACTDTPGASITVRFTGTAFGIYHRIFSDHGRVRVCIDGEEKGVLTCYYVYPADTECYGEYLSLFKCYGLAEGDHVAQITVLDQPDERATGNRISIAGFLVG